ncbi:ABC transporter permease [Vibrio sp. SS-MA-C1-2]|uniref:ABC transporter permease n=1 Tax=Vibrio sp. SS-MA-C1-2 TaxID=2908646 RepID=UPI001F16ADD7|nr:ABC transporter permease [Vibrio sp. SS-MA-C1-2]UJF17558.1 ABC transporter permease [Vibrio sp. SS-MA-C1-2]
MARSLTQRWKKEWSLIWYDKWLLTTVSITPILLFVLIAAIFQASFARDLPIGVVDLDHSELSRALTRQYDMSPTLEVTQSFSSVKEGVDAMRNSQIYGLVVLPFQMEKEALEGLSPEVTGFYNSQFILMGKLVNSALQTAHGTFDAGVGVLKNLALGESAIPLAFAKAVPVQSQISALYNSSTDYAQFLVSAAIPATWQIIIVISMILSLITQHRSRQYDFSDQPNNQFHGLHQWMNGQPIAALVIKSLVLQIPMMLLGLGFLFYFYIWLGWPMHGSWAILIISQWLMVLACQAMGAFFYFVAMEPARAFSVAAAYTAPSFAFIGITFPATDMPSLGLFWRSILPVSHYIKMQVVESSYGGSLTLLKPEFLAFGLFLLVFVFVIILMKKRDKQFSEQIKRDQLQVSQQQQVSQEAVSQQQSSHQEMV